MISNQEYAYSIGDETVVFENKLRNEGNNK